MVSFGDKIKQYTTSLLTKQHKGEENFTFMH